MTNSEYTNAFFTILQWSLAIIYDIESKGGEPVTTYAHMHMLCLIQSEREVKLELPLTTSQVRTIKKIESNTKACNSHTFSKEKKTASGGNGPDSRLKLRRIPTTVYKVTIQTKYFFKNQCL